MGVKHQSTIPSIISFANRLLRGSMLDFFYRLIRRPKDNLKRKTDCRYHGLFIGPPPELLTEDDFIPGDVLFCGQTDAGKKTDLIQNTTDGVYVHGALYLGESGRGGKGRRNSQISIKGFRPQLRPSERYALSLQ
jgi:hypothetical protein